MKKSILTLTSVIVLLTIGCSNSYYLKPVIRSNDNMDVIYHEGKPVALSFGEETTVGLYCIKTTDNELLLHVLYTNESSEKRITVIPEDIKIYGVDKQLQKKQLKVYSAKEYLRKMQRKQNWATVALAVAGAMEAEEAAKSTSTTSAYVTGSGGYAYGSATTQTYDASKKAEVEARNRAEIAKTQQQYALINTAVEQGLIKSHTLFPEQRIEGNVMVKFKKSYSNRFIIKIPIGKEVHTIIFVPDR